MATEYDLGSVKGLAEALGDNWQQTAELFDQGRYRLRPFVCGSLYCSRCQGYRRVRVTPLSNASSSETFYSASLGSFSFGSVFHMSNPATFVYRCIQCDACWTAVLFGKDGETQMALFPADIGGGVVTPNTPLGVSFYLDQASRCHNVEANSAAVVMFRSALEWLLYEQGYTEPMLGPKLASLLRAIDAGTAPRWAAELEPDFLSVIKNLGNTATHTNAGDLTKQDALDSALYRRLELTFLEILDVVYEKPVRRAQRLAELKAAAK